VILDPPFAVKVLNKAKSFKERQLSSSTHVAHERQGNENETRIFDSLESSAASRRETLSSAQSRVDMCFDSSALIMALQVEQIRDELLGAIQRGARVRIITEITEETLSICREVSDYVQMRHIAAVKSNFVVTESRCVAYDRFGEQRQLPSEVIVSTNRKIVSQHQYLFDVLWDGGVPLEDRITAIVEGKQEGETRLVHGFESATKVVLGVFENAKEFCYAYGDLFAPSVAIEVESYRRASELMRERHVTQKAITEITKENLDYCKMLMNFCELRHLEGSKGNFVVTENEFLCADLPLKSGSPVDCVLYSDSREVVGQHRQVFELLWKSSIPAKTRMSQIERGLEPVEDARLIRDISEGLSVSRNVISDCKEELLVIFPSERAILRDDLAYFDSIQSVLERGGRVRILAPISSGKVSKRLSSAEWRRIEPINACFAVVDRRRMISVFYDRPESEILETAVSSYLFSTNKHAASSMGKIFDELWDKSELEEMYDQRKREASLFRDVLTHDIRNYNQVSRLSAELLNEQMAANESARVLTESLLEAVEAEATLIERARKFARLLSKPTGKLHAVDLVASIERSLDIAKSLYSDKKVVSSIRLEGEQEARRGVAFVLADDFLDEVFINIFSNSIRYTREERVEIEIGIRSAELGDIRFSSSSPSANFSSPTRKRKNNNLEYWLVSIADHGPGIPDESKQLILRRYKNGTRVSGLGLSIVYELVVSRYGGDVRLEDRVSGDYTQGALVKVWLRKA